jgi:hypothetical protein
MSLNKMPGGFLSTIGISFVVSTAVVLINNYFLYKHSCKCKTIVLEPADSSMQVESVPATNTSDLVDTPDSSPRLESESDARPPVTRGRRGRKSNTQVE